LGIHSQAGNALMLRSVKAYAASLAVVDSVVEGKLAAIGVSERAREGGAS
jgi:hypothetical protein